MLVSLLLLLCCFNGAQAAQGTPGELYLLQSGLARRDEIASHLIVVVVSLEESALAHSLPSFAHL